MRWWYSQPLRSVSLARQRSRRPNVARRNSRLEPEITSNSGLSPIPHQHSPQRSLPKRRLRSDIASAAKMRGRFDTFPAFALRSAGPEQRAWHYTASVKGLRRPCQRLWASVDPSRNRCCSRGKVAREMVGEAQSGVGRCCFIHPPFPPVPSRTLPYPLLPARLPSPALRSLASSGQQFLHNGVQILVVSLRGACMRLTRGCKFEVFLTGIRCPHL